MYKESTNIIKFWKNIIILYDSKAIIDVLDITSGGFYYIGKLPVFTKGNLPKLVNWFNFYPIW